MFGKVFESFYTVTNYFPLVSSSLCHIQLIDSITLNFKSINFQPFFRSLCIIVIDTLDRNVWEYFRKLLRSHQLFSPSIRRYLLFSYSQKNQYISLSLSLCLCLPVFLSVYPLSLWLFLCHIQADKIASRCPTLLHSIGVKSVCVWIMTKRGKNDRNKLEFVKYCPVLVWSQQPPHHHALYLVSRWHSYMYSVYWWRLPDILIFWPIFFPRENVLNQSVSLCEKAPQT